jgi:transposase
MTGVDKIKEVRLLKYVNGLPIKEIVRRTKLARNTVRKILRSNNTEFTYQRNEQNRPVTGQIYETIEMWLEEDSSKPKKYRRTAWRMYEILKYEHGYDGSYESVAGCVRKAKKSLKLNKPKAYIPLSFSPGDAFQFDWGEIMVYIGKDLVTLQLAVITDLTLIVIPHFKLHKHVQLLEQEADNQVNYAV